MMPAGRSNQSDPWPAPLQRSWLNRWEINGATVKLSKLNLTLMQKQSQSAISVQTMKRQVVIHPSQVIHIIMMDCERRWLARRRPPLPPVFLRGQSDDELFFCSLAQHDTFSSPDGPHRDSLSRLVCCLVASAGQWNITRTSEPSLTWRTPAAANKRQPFVPLKGFSELFFLGFLRVSFGNVEPHRSVRFGSERVTVENVSVQHVKGETTLSPIIC